MLSYAAMRRVLGLSILASLVACGASDAPAVAPPDPPYVPPPETCSPVNLDDVKTFAPCTTGSGVFGQWSLDADGMVTYDYGLDENADARASWFNTEGLDRREHWASFGNDRVTALAYNDGYVEVTTQDRGETYLNKFDESQGNYAGGFSYVDDGSATWSTAYKWRPRGSVTRRRFGGYYFETETDYRGIAVTHRMYAPAGTVPAVLDDVTVENTTDAPKTIRHYEYWDVGRRPIEINWIVSGSALKGAPAAARATRDGRNAMFQEDVAWDESTQILGMRRAPLMTPPVTYDDPSPIDYYPGDPFLALLIGPRDGIYTDQRTFFGASGVARPDAVTSRAPGDPDHPASTPGDGQPRMLAIRSDMVLPAHGKQGLRFGFGFAPIGGPFVVQDEWHDPKCDMRIDARETLKSHMMYFATGNDGAGVSAAGALHRELAWHSQQLEASVAQRDYWKGAVVPQGSAYLYLHGADGAPRDLALFALPLVYTHPELAQSEVEMMMGLHLAADHRFIYAFQGAGMADDALGFHAQPSDLDIFFLLAVTELVGATGHGVLDLTEPYYPRSARPTATGYDHVHDAVRHLFDVVGTGPHGLVRIGDGDWDDGIVGEAPDRALAIASGESVPNTQMAVAVLPRVADVVEPRDAPLAAEIRAKVDAYKKALAQAWTGKFFGRAYFGDGNLAYADRINLQSQVWALIGGSLGSDADRATLVAQVGASLDDPSPAGAMLVADGQVWPAISGLLTWGYAKSDPARALAHLARNTMTGHALGYPSIWYGIWSGPDGLDGPTGDRPGEAWYSAATPMVDFPVMNANQHAMPMLAALRVAGVEASATGLVIDPHVPGRAFSLMTELLDLSQRGSSIKGAYRPDPMAARTVEVRAPAGGTIASASLNAAPVAVAPGATSVVIHVPPTMGQGAAFEVTTSP